MASTMIRMTTRVPIPIYMAVPLLVRLAGSHQLPLAGRHKRLWLKYW